MHYVLILMSGINYGQVFGLQAIIHQTSPLKLNSTALNRFMQASSWHFPYVNSFSFLQPYDI